MKKGIFLGLILLFSYFPFFAQNTWFKIHNLGFEEELPITIIPFGNDFIVLCENYDPTPPVTRNQVLRVDPYGEIIWRSYLSYPSSANADWILYHPVDMIITKDSFIYVSTHSENSVGEQETLINKFNSNGALVWAKSYGIAGNAVGTHYKGLSLSEDSLGLVMAGSEFLTKKLVFNKIDSAGNQLLTKLIAVPVAGPSIGYIAPIVRMPDNTYKIAYDNNVLLDYRDYLVSVDSSGNLEYSFTNPATGRAHDLALHPNGNLVYLSNERNPPMFEWGGLRIQMFTPDFDTIWSHLFYDTEFPYLFLESAFVRNLSISPDGKILALGYNTTNCILLCYNADGSLLWKREVALEGFNLLKFHYASWTGDGGILLDGYIYGTVNGVYDSKMFLLKLDALGCLEPGCEQTIITDTKDIEYSNNPFEVSPNPTSGEIKIEYKGINWDEVYQSTVRLYDSNGELIQNGTFDENVFRFNLKNLQAGVYYLSVISSQGSHYVTKIVRVF